MTRMLSLLLLSFSMLIAAPVMGQKDKLKEKDRKEQQDKDAKSGKGKLKSKGDGEVPPMTDSTLTDPDPTPKLVAADTVPADTAVAGGDSTLPEKRKYYTRVNAAQYFMAENLLAVARERTDGYAEMLEEEREKARSGEPDAWPGEKLEMAAEALEKARKDLDAVQGRLEFVRDKLMELGRLPAPGAENAPKDSVPPAPPVKGAKNALKGDPVRELDED